MNCKAVIAFLISLFFSFISYSQTTCFIKYKNSVDLSAIAEKIKSKQFISSKSIQSIGNLNISASFFARNLGKDDPNLSRIVKLTFPDYNSEQTFISQIKNDPSVEYVQSSNLYKIDSIPNDSLVSQQWALQKIKAFDAWNITQGSDTIIIGLIDTGIDYLHPDLKNKIYINKGEVGIDQKGNNKKNNGIDDDGNGFIDDYMGWDFTDRKGFPFDSTSGDYLGWDNDPMDENGHGTYIAGILAAETNNQIGIAGAAPKIRILNIRAFDPSGYGEEDDVASAILYAVKMGAKVINMSFGDTQYSNVLRDVIKYAYSKGVVLVASAGNDGSEEPHYPSGYSEVICVGNSTEDDYVASSSNYGSTLDLVAPGTNILTTEKGGGYTEVSGTSASAPFVSATTGLILSLGNFSNEDVKQILKSTADDIEQPGWDIRSGAGRLNMYKALSSLAPSIIKFDSPTQDYSTLSDTLKIYATVLSAYFSNYSLYIGTGQNPPTWINLIQDGQYQFENKNIYNLNLSSYADSTYCLRLVVQLNNGKTTEERVNFNIIRKPPSANLIFIGPAYYGDKATILASIHTDQLSVIKMYYKKSGEKDFSTISLDGFSSNTLSVNNLHYGFIPLDIVNQNTSYEIYFEAINQVGLTTIINNNGSDFNISTNFPLYPVYSTELPYALPPGEIYQYPLNITSTDSNEVAIRKSSNPQNSYFYKLSGSNFIKFDSLQGMILKDYGDFNNNGKKDLLTYFVYDGFIYEQLNPFSPNFVQKFADTTKIFWPILAQDIDGDGKTEILAIDSDTSFVVWKVQSNLSLSDSVRLTNFAQNVTENKVLDSPNAVITDLNGDGKKEIWMVDKGGDIFSYNIIGSDNYQKGKVISTGFESSSSYLTAGKYLGNGTTEMAVLLHSIPNIDIAPYYRLVIFNFIADSLNIIYDNAFIDPTTEFNTQFQQVDNSIRFADIDNDGRDELILFIYPYSYILKYENGQSSIISYEKNINSNSIFVGDLNKNGVPEVAFPTNSGIRFYEFAVSNYPSTPTDLTGYSIDSSNIHLGWIGYSNKYYVYRGDQQSDLILLDSTTSNNYKDTSCKNNFSYYYAIKSVDETKQYPTSNLSQIIKIYCHNPAQIISAISKSSNSVLITFSNKINNSIDDFNSFEILPSNFPSSVSTESQYSYLITFTDPLNTGENYLSIKNVNDFYGSPLKNDTVKFIVDSVSSQISFYVQSYEILNPYKIKLSFNMDVDSVSAVNINNYIFTPENKVTNVQVDNNDPKSIFLNLNGQKPVGSIGIQYKLRITNLISSDQSGNIKINSSSGSYIVLTKISDNLSDVYVYPSPVRILFGNEKITFANLPQRVKITIFNLNGKKINEIDRTSDNGGLDYNLMDIYGRLLNSGIYLFRIVRYDNSNNEVEQKIGKFAVIR
ncbi:MAG: S8 family serine peptidase [Bacteroidetes bacterium]|nr:S8 family serine peptidase [Bacteroidota bacterium]